MTEYEFWSGPEPTLSQLVLLLLGEKQSGKTAVRNSILGKQASHKSTTRSCKKMGDSFGVKVNNQVMSFSFTNFNFCLHSSEFHQPGDSGRHTRVAVSLHHSRQCVPGAQQRSGTLSPRTSCYPAGAAHLHHLWPSRVVGHGSSTQTASNFHVAASHGAVHPWRQAR